jgi:hypothetical protein
LASSAFFKKKGVRRRRVRKRVSRVSGTLFEGVKGVRYPFRARRKGVRRKGVRKEQVPFIQPPDRKRKLKISGMRSKGAGPIPERVPDTLSGLGYRITSMLTVPVR